MRYVATWGEGSERAQNLDRYGHTTKKTFFAEGIEAKVIYKGRLKSFLKPDLIKIKAALANTGSMNLEEFREQSVIEILSQPSGSIVSKPHNIK